MNHLVSVATVKAGGWGERSEGKVLHFRKSPKLRRTWLDDKIQSVHHEKGLSRELSHNDLNHQHIKVAVGKASVILSCILL